MLLSIARRGRAGVLLLAIAPLAVASASAASGISRDYWTKIPGHTIEHLTADPRFPNQPSGSSTLDRLEIPSNFANNYGTRVRGYLHPPKSGNYVFWIASDNNGSLRLSSDDNPVNAREIASVGKSVGSRQWDVHASQKSQSVYLQAGQRYYIEVLHKEASGGDHMAVAWQGPGLTRQVIEGRYLSPWGSVQEPAPPPSPVPATGGIDREYWTRIPGHSIEDLVQNPRYPDQPTGTSTLSRLEIPVDFANNYGTRVRGYLHPPSSGDYVFWIASDNSGSLRLSPDDDPSKAREIASVSKSVAPREWDARPSQKSAPVRLEGGRRYYIEVLHKEASGGDHMAVAWQGPGLTRQVIQGAYLSPWREGEADNPPSGDPLDADGDGIPDAWELEHGLNPFDPSDASADHDGDGATNLDEWRAGSDPNQAHSTPTLSMVVLEWEPPLLWTDGTPLMPHQLAGFRVRWGAQPGQYSHSTTVDDPYARGFAVTGLKRNVRYYFAVSAVDVDGRESDLSGELSAPAQR